MPLIVSQPQFAAPDGDLINRIPVGIARWGGPEDLFSFVVKLTFTFGTDANADDVVVARLYEQQAPLRLDTPCELPGAAEDELAYASDFRFYRSNVDVLLTGHAHAPQPTYGIDASIKVGKVFRQFQVVAADAALQLPMTQHAIRDPNAGDYACPPVGPVPAPREDENVPLERVDFAQHQHAPPAQQLEDLEPDAMIELKGLSPRGNLRRVQLPGLVPQLHVDGGPYGEGLIRLRCDTLWIDTDFELIECVWRAVSPVKQAAMGEIGIILVSVEHAGEPRSFEEHEKTMCRGTFHYVVEETDLPDGPEEVSGADLTFAKLRARAPQPEPQITIEKYAAVSAELAEKREPREAILEKHGLDADSWSLEERGWMGKMSDAAISGNAALTTEFSALYLAAQKALADPAEEDFALDDYADMKAAMEDGVSQGKVLRGRDMSVTAWIRIDNRWRAAARQDEKVAANLQRALERARAARHGTREEPES